MTTFSQTTSINSQFSAPQSHKHRPPTWIFSFPEDEVSNCLLSSHAFTCPLDPIPFKPFLPDSYLPSHTSSSLLTGTFTTTVKQAWVKVTNGKPYIHRKLQINVSPLLHSINTCVSYLQPELCIPLTDQPAGQHSVRFIKLLLSRNHLSRNVTEAKHIVRGVSTSSALSICILPHS